MRNILMNEKLLVDNLLDTDYYYVASPNSVGIATNNQNGKRHYYVYITDERSNIFFTKEHNTFGEALLYARRMYKGLVSYYQGMLDNNRNKKR